MFGFDCCGDGEGWWCINLISGTLMFCQQQGRGKRGVHECLQRLSRRPPHFPPPPFPHCLRAPKPQRSPPIFDRLDAAAPRRENKARAGGRVLLARSHCLSTPSTPLPAVYESQAGGGAAQWRQTRQGCGRGEGERGRREGRGGSPCVGQAVEPSPPFHPPPHPTLSPIGLAGASRLGAPTPFPSLPAFLMKAKPGGARQWRQAQTAQQGGGEEGREKGREGGSPGTGQAVEPPAPTLSPIGWLHGSKGCCAGAAAGWRLKARSPPPKPPPRRHCACDAPAAVKQRGGAAAPPRPSPPAERLGRRGR